MISHFLAVKQKLNFRESYLTENISVIEWNCIIDCGLGEKNKTLSYRVVLRSLLSSHLINILRAKSHYSLEKCFF